MASPFRLKGHAAYLLRRRTWHHAHHRQVRRGNRQTTTAKRLRSVWTSLQRMCRHRHKNLLDGRKCFHSADRTALIAAGGGHQRARLSCALALWARYEHVTGAAALSHGCNIVLRERNAICCIAATCHADCYSDMERPPLEDVARRLSAKRGVVDSQHPHDPGRITPAGDPCSTEERCFQVCALLPQIARHRRRCRHQIGNDLLGPGRRPPLQGRRTGSICSPSQAAGRARRVSLQGAHTA